MTDKQKIKAKVKDLIRQNELYESENATDAVRYQKTGAYSVLNEVLYFIDSLQEEPVSKDFEMALAEMVDKAQKCVVEPWVIAAQWKDYLIELAKSEEPVSEELMDD